MIKLSHSALGGILAVFAILANLTIAFANHAAAIEADQARWKSEVEQRLTRVETKIDRLLNVNQAALDAGRGLPHAYLP